jgi:beta-mannosidase
MLLRKRLSPLLAAAILPQLAVTQHVIDLSGDGWTVRNAQGNITVPGHLPSQVHLDLYAAKVIGE